MKVRLSFDQIQGRIVEMGKQIAADYAGREPHFVGVLKGACPFMTDLAQAIDLPLTLDYIAVSSYGKATKSSGEVKLIKDLAAMHKAVIYRICQDTPEAPQTS